MEEKKFVLKRINGGGSVGIYETEGGPTVYMYSEAPTIEVTIRPIKSKRERKLEAIERGFGELRPAELILENLEAIDREGP